MEQGLSQEVAQARLAQEGPNALARQRRTPPWRIWLRQLRGALIWLLLGACVLSALLGERADAIAIAAILLLNATVGFFQELRAERALFALRALTAPRARVLRDGHARVLPAAQVVRGDWLLLEAGDVVAADGRLLEAHALITVEAALTGESAPVHKQVEAAPADAPLAEQHHRVFLGTSVASGTGVAEVTATGMHTELGRIAHLLAATPEETTPLQRRLEGVGRTLLWLCLALVAVVAAAGLARGMAGSDVLVASVSLAVAAVPEGLATLMTLALALGVRRMAARHVLVRRLPAVETLGAATVVCTDKTGTLTQGVMTVRETWSPNEARLLFAAAAACDAELTGPNAGVGDPTELALLQAARAQGIERARIEQERPRQATLPFTPERRRMSILRADGTLYLKGALEVVLPRCVAGAEGAEVANARLAARGLRVLAVAVGQGPREEALTLLGLVGLADPPRPEAITALAEARAAGVRTVMVTGDHPDTAAAIAREMGLLLPGEPLAERVHARVTAEEKLRIVREWKARGEIVAMTGDGVNDAPALREAHIGIAMGRTGTEVTREAADLILTDDDFASIVAAIREGRGIFDNLRKTLVYLLSGNLGELLLMLLALVAGLPLPLLPLQLLWVNLVTDGLPALALVMDPPEADVLQRPPRAPREPMLGAPQWRAVVLTGALQVTVTLGAFVWGLGAGDAAFARSLAFTVLVFGEVLRAFSARSPTRTFWETHPKGNLLLIAVGALSLAAQAGLFALPAARRLFALTPLDGRAWGIALALALLPVSVLELLKLARRAARARSPRPL